MLLDLTPIAQAQVTQTQGQTVHTFVSNKSEGRSSIHFAGRPTAPNSKISIVDVGKAINLLARFKSQTEEAHLVAIRNQMELSVLKQK